MDKHAQSLIPAWVCVGYKLLHVCMGYGLGLCHYILKRDHLQLMWWGGETADLNMKKDRLWL